MRIIEKHSPDGERSKKIILFRIQGADAETLMGAAVRAAIGHLERPNGMAQVDGAVVIEEPQVVIGRRRIAITQLQYVNV
jgi:hypothetical protein